MAVFNRKGPGKGREHLTPEVITDKNGVQKVVYKNNTSRQRDSSHESDIYNTDNSFSFQKNDNDGYTDIAEDAVDSLYDIKPMIVNYESLDRIHNMTESQFYENMRHHDDNIENLRHQTSLVKNGKEALALSTKILSSPEYRRAAEDYATSTIDYDEKRQVVQGYEKDIENAVFNNDTSFQHNEKEYFKIVDDAQRSYDQSQILAKSYQEYKDVLKNLGDIARQDDTISENLIAEKDNQLVRINSEVENAIDKGKPEWALGHSGTQRSSEAFPPDVSAHPDLSGRKMMHIKELAAMTGKTPEQLSQEYQGRLSGTSPQDVENTLLSMYSDAVIQGEKDWIYTDIETSNTGPLNGKIIEQAIVKNGKTENYRFGVGKFHETGSGTGMTSIHGISPEDVRGMETYRNSQDAKHISKMFTSGTKSNPVVIVAHHGGSFEDDWFNKNIPGYIQAKIDGRVVMVDSKTISKHSMKSKKNRLKDYIEAAGGSYENAHSADADTEMMYRATLDWAQKTRNR